jgi:2-polyprenyl-3-methyl-5-hydroxy-6-metoxy-1,4-benzoquinol methylase
MNLKKIRPEEMHDRALLLREKSGVEFYLNEKNGFVKVNCPVCLDKDQMKSFNFYKYGFKHYECAECKTLYVSPRPTEGQLFKYYSESEAISFWTKLLISTNNERKKIQHIPRVKELKRIINRTDNQKHTLVDLGAGNGNFLKTILDANIFNNVLATDISDECIESCESQGLVAKKCTVKDLKNDSIDCITFNDLIEHVFDPFDFLTSCYDKLRKNGVLMLSTPNGQGFDFKVLQDKTENITPPEHLQYFNPYSIRKILSKIGFKIISISTPGVLDVEIIKRQVNSKGLNLKKSNEFLSFLYSLKDDSVEESLQKFLQENNLSSHMLIFVEKK